MAKIILNIPDNEFGVDIQNKFQDFFKRLEVETKSHLESGTSLLCGSYELETIEMFLNAFKEMQIIPDNATNGDMIKAMFPNAKIVRGLYGISGTHLMCMNLGTRYDVHEMSFVEDWWNAPYKGGNLDGSN